MLWWRNNIFHLKNYEVVKKWYIYIYILKHFNKEGSDDIDITYRRYKTRRTIKSRNEILWNKEVGSQRNNDI